MHHRPPLSPEIDEKSSHEEYITWYLKFLSKILASYKCKKNIRNTWSLSYKSKKENLNNIFG